MWSLHANPLESFPNPTSFSSSTSSNPFPVYTLAVFANKKEAKKSSSDTVLNLKIM